jgi:two-component sensor histidine kinase/GAF domain-containing protein
LKDRDKRHNESTEGQGNQADPAPRSPKQSADLRPLIRHHSAAFDVFPFATTLIDSDGTILDLNQPMLAFAWSLGFEIKKQDRVGQHVSLFAGSIEGTQRLRQFVDSLFEEGRDKNLHWSMEEGPAGPVHVIIHGNLLHDSEGALTGAILVREDVTSKERENKRKQIIHRIREQVWSMRASDDIEQLLLTVRQALIDLGLHFNDCAVNLVDTTTSPPRVLFHSMTSDDRWLQVESEGEGVNTILEIWRLKETAYRRDLAAEDQFGENSYIHTGMGHQIRSVIDIPFSHGTLAINNAEPDAFSSEDIDILLEVAAVLGEGFARLDDFQLLEQRNRELEQEVAARQQAEELLQQSHEELEHQVEERTADLRGANQILAQEISERERQKNRQLALQRVREEMWKMKREEDIDKVLATIKSSLVSLEIPFKDCAINTVDTTTTPPSVKTRAIDPEARIKSLACGSGVVLKLWQNGGPTYRRDLGEADVFQEQMKIEEHYHHTVRSVVDVPFSQGTLAVNSAEPDAFSQEDIDILQEMANVLSETYQRLNDMRLMEKHNRALQAEVIERQQAEERLRRSLDEKEVLLKEIHHRVKNNLQIVSSLIDLQARLAPDPPIQQMFRDSRDRIRSMALLHERLYQSNDLTHIDLPDYIKILSGELFHSYGAMPDQVSLEVAVDEISLGINEAIACGLIINELVSNALKHAFPEDRSGKVCISLHASKTDKLCLSVSDDGVGLPADLDLSRLQSLGLKLVASLTNQLKGELEFFTTTGADFRVTFPTGNPDPPK